MTDEKGHKHLISQAIRDITEIFHEMGFSHASGPEMTNNYDNFEVLNFPDDHPARDMQDTFWLKPEGSQKLLRTQTSTVQVPYMKEHKPPIRIFVPGKVYRNEATDSTHEVQFYQVEGLVVDKGITLEHLKGTLLTLLKKFFDDENIEVRFRPGYFPFVEPGVELDMKFKGKWVELLGAGMVHPTVLKNGGIDPKEYSGFAFGLGIDRVVMMRHKSNDVRKHYDGDLRFVNQF
jgi:phenylalanyl-tRNA synthetase alpha chain